MDKKYIARINILSHIAQFALANFSGDYPIGLENMRFSPIKNPPVGALVSLIYSPHSKWYLSWVIDYFISDTGWETHTLESIEDGEICNWQNVGFIMYSQSEVKSHPEWRWTDKQYTFNTRWKKADKRNRAYLPRPYQAIFNDDDSVILEVGNRHDSKGVISRTFDPWRKTTIPMMDKFYKEACEELEN